MQLDQRTRELAEAQKHLAEALEQQTATSEILGTVAHSSADIQSVLDAVCQSAARLCQAYDSSIWRPDGDRLLLVAFQGPKPDLFRWSATIPRADRFSISGPYILLTCKRRRTNFL
jgi:hypothetical protein